MANMTDYLEAALLNHIFRTATFAKPAAIYIAMFSANPTDTGGGTEITTGGAVRVQVTQADANWTAPGAAGLTDNVAAITFATNSSTAYTVTGIAIFDAVTAGNMLFWGALSVSKAIATGEQFRINAGDLDITLA